MAQRQKKSDISLTQHAINNGISPHYNLPSPHDEHEDGRHTDENIQTLFLPEDLERKLNALMTKYRTWEQETGINVLHAAFGFLEWNEPNNPDSAFAPLVILPVKLEKKKTRMGTEFWVNADGDDLDTNFVLAEKMRNDFDIILPQFQQGDSIEAYFRKVAEVAPNVMKKWKVRRQAAFGVFPSAKMAMHADLAGNNHDFSSNEIVLDILGGTGSYTTAFADEYEIDDPNIESKVPYLVLDADASQFSSIVDVIDGKNIAVEGPPGTGKSQTIVNTIAVAMAQGKKVLFIAEKMAALEVVKSRLEAVGLGEFLLPLQATRSTREQVIESIRNRLEMDTPIPPHDYKTKIDKFRTVRSEISKYIEIISAPFGKTGLNLYEIIGKNIVIGDILADTPQCMQSPRILDIENFDKAKRDDIIKAGRDLEKAWNESSQSAPYWSGLTIPYLDPIMASKLTQLAHDLSAAFDVSNQSRKILEEYGISKIENTKDLISLLQSLNNISPQLSYFDKNLISQIFRSPNYNEIKYFMQNCQWLQTEKESLEQIVAKPVDQETSNTLRKISKTCSENNLQKFDIVALQTDITQYESIIKTKKETLRNLKIFIEYFPEAASIPIDALRQANKTVGDFDKKIIAIRNKSTADPDAVILLSRLCQKGRKLCNDRASLADVISTTIEISTSDLLAYAKCIKNSGIFSWLSTRFRTAKRAYITHSKRHKFTKNEAVNDFLKLAKWKEAEQNFVNDKQAHIFFGVHFNGIDTDFSLFIQLTNYYQRVEANFSGMENRELRTILKMGDPDFLFSIPSIPDAESSKTINDLETEINKLESTLTVQKEAVKFFENNISILLFPNQIAINSLDGIANRIEKAVAIRKKLDKDEVTKDILRDNFCNNNTDFNKYLVELKILSILDDNNKYSSLLCTLLETSKIEEFAIFIEKIVNNDNLITSLLSELEEKSGIHFRNQIAKQINVAHFFRYAAKDREGLYAHFALKIARSEINSFGLGWVVDTLENEDRSFSGLGALLEAIIFRTMIVRAYERYGPELSRYPGAKLDELRTDLAQLDREIIDLSQQHIRAQIHHAAHPPMGINKGLKSEYTQMSLIGNELSKKQRFIPIRDLTSRAGKALLELKPCWMMSPLAVAQYLPSDAISFDLCILDEASQMPPENAIGALVRCRQAMVVGDTKQLPPTNFFRKMFEDDDSDEDNDILEESILEMANAAFRPLRRLRWHYRSRHSGLIQFSNQHMYNNDLVIFPSPSESNPDMGVSLVEVEGRYRSGINTEEASTIVKAALDFMHNDPNRSLGIVTLNQKQRDLILEEMERALNRDIIATKYVEDWKERNDGLESFFVKNLENVQGDERDVIFIGTVYGPEKLGMRVMQRFGPVNGTAGERRLNVLFSRAKQKIVTFSSMTAADITAVENGNRGAYMLKCWLEYAKTGVLHTGEITNREPDSDFEVYVINQLQSIGCIPVPQVGVAGFRIDIGVKHQSWPHSEFIMGVECDGAAYHTSRSARDRDRLREEILTGLGWKLYRIWSTSWFIDPIKEAQKLRRAVEERLQELKRSEAPAISAKSAELNTALPKEEVQFVKTAQRKIDESPIKNHNDVIVEIGDTVKVSYLDRDKSIREVTLSDINDVPDQNILHISKPLGRALLYAELGEEIEILSGNFVRKACIEHITKAKLK